MVGGLPSLSGPEQDTSVRRGDQTGLGAADGKTADLGRNAVAVDEVRTSGMPTGCRVVIATVAVVGGILAFMIWPLDWYLSYASWRDLSKAELADAARDYVDERAPGNRACLYAVTCQEGRAGLELVKSLDEWDIEPARQLAWDRRFSGVCPGQTANFAVALATDTTAYKETQDQYRYGVWSFANDRFLPSWGRFTPFRAFSELPTEPCTTRDAVTGPPGRREVAPEGS